MPITATCPSCSKMCQVEDQYAGMMVRCPHCSNILQVARLNPVVAQGVPPPPPPAGPVAAVPPPAPPPLGEASPSNARPALMDTIQASAKTLGLDALVLKLIYAGMGCFAVMIVSTLLPWDSLHNPLLHVSYTRLGIATEIGWINILLTLAAAGFLVAVFMALKQVKFLDYSLYGAAGWGVLAFLWRLSDVSRLGGLAGIGLYLALLASLGAAGTFGYLVFLRLAKK